MPNLDDTDNRHRRRRCGSSWRRTARIRPARRATGGWIRSDSASRISTPSGRGGQWTASFRSTRPATLPDGEEFEGPVELRAILKGEREAFTRTLTSKLLTYALGRGLERYDTKTVRQIASRLPAHNYKFSSLVLEIVNSLPFLSRRPMAESPRIDTVATAHGNTADLTRQR